jgi:hypothetical protein
MLADKLQRVFDCRFETASSLSDINQNNAIHLPNLGSSKMFL